MESSIGMGTGMDRPLSSNTRSTDELKDKAQQLTESARGKAMTALDSNKDQICVAIEKVAEAMQDDPYGRYAAQYVRRGADYLRAHSADEMLSSMRGGMRERPVAILGACFLAGLAFSRMLKE